MTQEIRRKLRLVQMDILDRVVQVCEANNITYYLVAGTLLGAVRHGGFIPWDDDVDIAMPRRDYDRFYKLWCSMDDPLYDIRCFHTDRTYNKPYAKIQRRNTLLIERENQNLPSTNQKIFVDVFPLDNAFSTHGIQWLQKKVVWKLVSFSQKRYSAELSGKKSIYWLLPYGLLHHARQFVMKLVFWQNSRYYIGLGSQYSVDKQTFAKGVYNPPGSVVFEGKTYAAPRETDTFLKQLYGTRYMQPPPIDQQKGHDVVCIRFDLDAVHSDEEI